MACLFSVCFCELDYTLSYKLLFLNHLRFSCDYYTNKVRESVIVFLWKKQQDFPRVRKKIEGRLS